jgi:hypothetical protein
MRVSPSQVTLNPFGRQNLAYRGWAPDPVAATREGRQTAPSPMVGKPVQPDQLDTELLETGDDPVQRGLVDQVSAKLGLRCHGCGPERMQRREDVRTDPAPDPERVLVAHHRLHS